MINGKNIKVYSGSTPIAAAKSCSISASHSPVQTVPSGDWRYNTYTEGKQTWKISVSGLVVAEATGTKKNPLDILSDMGSRLIISVDNPVGGKLQGNCYPTDLQYQADVNKLATYSITFVGTGKLTKVQ